MPGSSYSRTPTVLRDPSIGVRETVTKQALSRCLWVGQSWYSHLHSMTLGTRVMFQCFDFPARTWLSFEWSLCKTLSTEKVCVSCSVSRSVYWREFIDLALLSTHVQLLFLYYLLSSPSFTLFYVFSNTFSFEKADLLHFFAHHHETEDLWKRIIFS